MFSQNFIYYLIEVVFPSYLTISIGIIRKPWYIFYSYTNFVMAINTIFAIVSLISNPLVWLSDRYASYIVFKKQQEIEKAKASVKVISAEEMKNLPVEVIRKMRESESVSPETLALQRAQIRARRAKAVRFVYGLIVYIITVYGYTMF